MRAILRWNGARDAIFSLCSHAFATTDVGSIKHATVAEPRIELDGELGLDPPLRCRVPVALLDAALGVVAVAAEVPFAESARLAGQRVGPPHDARHQVTGGEATACRRIDHLPERLMAEHETVLTRRRPAVALLDDLDVGAAHADQQTLHEQRAFVGDGSG